MTYGGFCLESFLQATCSERAIGRPGYLPMFSRNVVWCVGRGIKLSVICGVRRLTEAACFAKRPEPHLILILVRAYLGDGRETVGGARGVGHHVRASLLVFVVVDAHHVHRGVILGGRRDEHLLSSACS